MEKDLNVYNDIDTVPESFKPDIVTMFHVLEHIPDPIAMLKKIKNRWFSDTRIARGGNLILEVPSASDALLTRKEKMCDTVIGIFS